MFSCQADTSHLANILCPINVANDERAVCQSKCCTPVPKPSLADYVRASVKKSDIFDGTLLGVLGVIMMFLLLAVCFINSRYFRGEQGKSEYMWSLQARLAYEREQKKLQDELDKEWKKEQKKNRKSSKKFDPHKIMVHTIILLNRRIFIKR